MRRPLPPILFALAALILARCSGGDGQGNRFEPDAADDAVEVITDVVLVPPDGQGDGDPVDVLDPTDAPADAAPDACLLTCGDRECGAVCGTPCGTCAEGATCTADGHCVTTCQPACDGRQCGDDGCGGSCGACQSDQICTDLGHCATAPTCTEVTKIGCCEADVLWACEGGVVVPTACPPVGGCGWLEAAGAYGCGGEGLAGPHGTFPLDCPWVCRPLCVGQECGPDGCGGSCGVCPEGTACDFAGACCEPTCTTATGAAKQCGSDGCGGSCGACGLGEVCFQDGTCQSPCGGACVGRECGPDGCGGVCGACGPNLSCTDAGACVVECTSTCQGKACGGDGCGGSCGTCPSGQFCDDGGACGTTCAPDCMGKQCGDDGCGGSCGTCEDDLLCTLEQACGSSCLDCGFAPECLAFGFEPGNLLGWSTTAQPLVLTTLGATAAPQGSFMLDLDTEGEGGANDAATIQTCVPGNALTLHFVWRLYSEEFQEFCGTQYQDYFRVTVGYDDGHDILFQRTIDELCPKGSCLSCGEFEVPLVPSDVAFDQGDVWVTPWQVANLPLSGVVPAEGGILSLTFEAGDEGDSIYDTHILVDEIALVQGCEAACLGASGAAKECGDDGCGGLCGVCPQGGTCEADGTCSGCQPQCDGKDCGVDGCGGSCGTCAQGSSCVAGACVASAEKMGSPCATVADCDDGMYCLPSVVFPSSGPTLCTIACDVNAITACPEGFGCFPNLAGGGADPAAYCVAGGGFPG